MAQQVSGFAWHFLAGKILAPWSGPLLPLPSPQAHRLFVDFPSPAKLPRAVTYLCLHLLVSSFPLCPLLSGLTPSASPNTLSLFQLPNSEHISQASSSSATHLDFVLEILLPLFSRPLTFPPASRRCPPRWPLLSSEDHRSSPRRFLFLEQPSQSPPSSGLLRSFKIPRRHGTPAGGTPSFQRT